MDGRIECKPASCDSQVEAAAAYGGNESPLRLASCDITPRSGYLGGSGLKYDDVPPMND